MKKLLPVFLVSLLAVASSRGQGLGTIPPVPVTNGVTGVLADASILAAVYYGPGNTPLNSLMPILPASPLVNGYARFGSLTTFPVVPPGVSILLQVRAWSSPFATYEDAVSSGQASVLAGTSIPIITVLGSLPGPPPIPTINIPGFTIEPVPEPSALMLVLAAAAMCGFFQRAGRSGKNRSDE